MSVTVRFERERDLKARATWLAKHPDEICDLGEFILDGPENTIELGPFQWVQFTYQSLRVSEDEGDSNPAWWDGDLDVWCVPDWTADVTRYFSDIVIGSGE